ncbi:MAG: alpha/beta hydrolase [Pseudomonadota bacterium]
MAENLHPEARALLALLERPGIPAFHELSIAEQRRASRKLHFAFRPPMPAGVVQVDLRLERVAAAGGPLRARLYRPACAARPMPVLLWFHGGGCVLGDLDSYDVLCAQLSQGAGAAVLAPDYRLAPEHPFPAAVDDAVFCLRWLRQRAAALGLDGARIAVGGDSAGGYLAIVAMLVLRDEDRWVPRFQLLVYPGTDQRCVTASHARYGEGCLLTEATIRHFRHCYLPRPEDRLDWRASPLLAPSLDGLPSALVITAECDPIVDDCQAYADRLAASGVAVEYRCYGGMIHGFFTLGQAFSAGREAVAEAARRLAAALG